MNKERLDMFNEYIKSGISPILLENIESSIFDSAVILSFNCDNSELNGHYENIDFCPPIWYSELLKKQTPILVIDNINKLKKEEQTKFIEILKYKKISTFNLPKNCIIIVTASNLKERPINEEVFSLLVHI